MVKPVAIVTIRAIPPVQPSSGVGEKEKKLAFQRCSPGPGGVWDPPPRAGPKASPARGPKRGG
ncbi:unnamed protein product [Prunus armeniaca]